MGELVQDGDVHPGVVVYHVVHEIGPDEAAATGDDGSVEKVGVVPDPKRVGPASQNLEYG